MTHIYPTWPNFSACEAEAVRDVIASNRVNYWTGDIGRSFEQEFARWTGTKQAVCLANGTLALDLALRALEIGSGDEVIVTPRTFIASVSSVVNAGAVPVFADVNRDSGNISPQTIASVITDRTRAIIPVHLAGWPADMPGILQLAKEHDLSVIEDCAQAHGGQIGDQSVGSFGDIGAWSFCQDKIMTTGGEGGMVTTNNRQYWSKMWSYKDHGKNWEAVYERQHPPGFRWVHDSFGTNWRMLEVQAALGRIQLKKMAEWTARRTIIALAIAEMLREFEAAVRVPLPEKGFRHAYYRQYAYVNPDGLKDGWDRDRIVAEMMEQGAPVMHGTCSEVYMEKAFEGTGLRPENRLPNARLLGETSIMFLTHPNLGDDDVDRICAITRGVFQRASK